MKKTQLILIAAMLVATSLTGCMMPNYTRLVPENKDAHIMVFSPLYGWAVIDTRVDPKGTNPLPPLDPPPAVPKITIEAK